MNRKSLMISVAAMMAAVSACGEKEPQKPTIVQPGGGEDTSIKVGEILPAWQEGEMDIHFINTTTGESAFVIMPDGTQLLIDAASSLVKTNSDGNTTNTADGIRQPPVHEVPRSFRNT